MIKKVINEIKENKWFYIFIVIIITMGIIPLDYEIYTPGGLENLNDRIIVDNAYDYDGSFNLTYVSARRATPINLIIAFLMPSWDIVDLDESRVENESAKEIEERGKVYLKETSYDAVIAAFKSANLEYEITNQNLTISYVFDSAETNLKIGDIIKSINGVEINDYDSLKNELLKYKVNDRINIQILRDNNEKECYSVLKEENGTLVIGISLAILKEVKTNPKVEFVFEDNESGSSRGLLCALDIYNKITEYDLTKGRIISGTGSIDENGIVGAISGVKYKLLGAVKKGADVFIVPKDNYEEAIKLKEENNYNIEIITATTLDDVIEKLK